MGEPLIHQPLPEFRDGESLSDTVAMLPILFFTAGSWRVFALAAAAALQTAALCTLPLQTQATRRGQVKGWQIKAQAARARRPSVVRIGKMRIISEASRRAASPEPFPRALRPPQPRSPHWLSPRSRRGVHRRALHHLCAGLVRRSALHDRLNRAQPLSMFARTLPPHRQRATWARHASGFDVDVDRSVAAWRATIASGGHRRRA